MQTRFRSTIGMAVLAVVVMPQGCCCLSGYFGYQQKNGKWVYASMAGEWPLDADESLTVLSDPHYAKDRSKVFFKGGELKDADPDTFELDDHKFSHDKSHVYYDSRLVRDADPATFEIIRAIYARDAQRIYCGTVPMNVAHPDNFEVVMESTMYIGTFAKELIEKQYGPEFADWPVDEFPFFVCEGWSRDGEFWYWGPSRIEGADYDTFKPIDHRHAADKHGRFVGRLPEEIWLEQRRENAVAPEPAQAPAE